MGFAWAAAYGGYLLRDNLKSGHEQLLGQARALARGRPRTGKTTGVSRACFSKPACMQTLAVWCPLIRLLHTAYCTQAHAFEERLARLEAAAKGQ